MQRLAHEAAHQRPGQHAIQQRRATRFGLARDELARRGLGVGRKHQAVEEPGALRLVGAQRLAGQHHLHGGAHAGEAHGAHRAAKSGVDAQHHFGQSDGKLVALDADAITAGQRQLEAAAEGEAVDDGDAGAGQRFDARQDAVRAAHHLHALLDALRAAANSLTSAPAMKPLALPERITRPRRRRTLERGQVRLELDAGCRATGRWSKCRACRTSARRCRRHRFRGPRRPSGYGGL